MFGRVPEIFVQVLPPFVDEKILFPLENPENVTHIFSGSILETAIYVIDALDGKPVVIYVQEAPPFVVLLIDDEVAA